MRSIKKRETLQLIFFFSIIFLLGYGIFSQSRLAIPLALSYILFLITKPVLPVVQKLGLGKDISVVIIVSGILFFTIYPIVKFVPHITKESQNFQQYIPKIERYLREKNTLIQSEVKERFRYEIKNDLFEGPLEKAKSGATSILLNIPTLLASLIEWIFVVPLFVFFFLRDSKNFKIFMMKMTPNSIFERFYNISYEFNKKIGGYIFAKFIEASIVGSIITFGLIFMGVKFSLLLGFVAAVTNIIPYVGPLLGAVPGLIIGLAEYGAGPKFGGIFFLYLTANAIDIGLVFPILVSKIVDLHPVIVVISVILGSQYFGLAGMVISIPVAAAVKLIIQEFIASLYGSRLRQF